MAGGNSNIEKVMSTTAQETLTAWRTAGAIESNRVQGVRRSVRRKLERVLEDGSGQEIVRGILMGELTEEQREYVRSIVPESIPDEQISPLVAMVYSTVAHAVKKGDAQSLERLMRLSGEAPEVKLRLGNLDDKPFALLDLGSMTDEELRRLADRQLEIVDEDI